MRLFVAFDLPADLVGAIGTWQARALDRHAWRPVHPDALHLTLVFIGSRPPDQIEGLAEVIAETLPATAATLELLPSPVGIPRRRPNALAFEAKAPGVAELAEDLARAMEDAGLHEREARPFWPHLTVARRRAAKTGAGVRSGRAKPARPAIPSTPLPAPICEPVALDRVVLYRSETGPEGARHHAAAEFRLAA